MLINAEYFYGGLTRIAQIESTTEESVKDAVESYIALYEPEFLTKILGYAFYQLMSDNITEQRFVDLIEGKTYTDTHNYTRRWNGLTYIVGTDKYSPIANYVYWHYLRDTAVQMGGIGTAITNTENATRVSVIQKQVTAWNAMIDIVQQMYCYLDDNKAIYPEFDTNQCDNLWKQNEFNI